ncbi:glycosyl transferase [Tepidibacter formicigenes]|jgi:hypothetical protein|uniref:Uncharacterized protein n=1 Tax=Tepidibacter formicigenes DSM 15518 TaxID=1123349 RepID=A0A1M6JM89_9FIRM|nr:glycosyl transferase [Tepidibacter formicigenes]SHJ47807.1 hypothetical protein SAMN02744037_00137 [Tepidibacter formicigenes DSM 15518]
MLENKFDAVTVKKYKEDLNDLFFMINDFLYGIDMQRMDKSDLEVLISSFAKVIRLTGMYNDIIEQVIVDKEIVTADPQKYISLNLNSAIILVEGIYSKYKV